MGSWDRLIHHRSHYQRKTSPALSFVPSPAITHWKATISVTLTVLIGKATISVTLTVLIGKATISVTLTVLIGKATISVTLTVLIGKATISVVSHWCE